MNPFSAWPVVAATFLALGTAYLLLGKSRPEAESAARFVSIDGLRGYLAFGVFLHHAAVWYVYLRTDRWAVPPSKLYAQLGQSSVMLFFMITGFLFWTKLLDSRTRPISWSKLYLSRILRLGPLYAFATACLVLASLYASGFKLHEPLSALMQHTSQWLAFTLLGTPDINRFTETGQLLGVGWSLRYEWLFYAFLPAGAMLLKVAGTLRVRFAPHSPRAAVERGAATPSPAEGIGILAGIGGVAATTTIAALIPGLDRMMLLAFGGGMLAAHVVRVEAVRRRFVGRFWSLVVAAAIAAIVGFYPSAYSLPVIALLTLTFTIIACGNTMFGVLHWRVSRILGEITYSIYLLHNFVLFIAFRVVLGHSAATLSPTFYWLVVCGLVPVLVVVCRTTFRTIEAPAMSLTPRVHAWLATRLMFSPPIRVLRDIRR